MRWLAVPLTLYGVLTAGACASQRALLFPAPRAVREPRLAGASLVRAPGAVALYLPAPAGAPTVVHFHGNGEQLADVTGLVAMLGSRGLGVYAVEYPGYGLLAAQAPGEEALFAAAEAALGYLHGALGVPAERVVLQGQSLGTGVAAEMARRGHGARLVLLSPYTSVADLAAGMVPLLPVRWLVRDRFDTAARAPGIAVPVLIVHGTQDELIPVAMGERLAGLFPRARIERVRGAGHNDLWARGGTALLGTIVAFARGP